MGEHTTLVTDWDAYFYAIAKVVSKRSKDTTQVGAVIAREHDHVLLSTGYNGPAREVLDLTSRLKHPKNKLPWMCHAETNAIYNAIRSGASLANGSLYVTKFPCVMCASAVVQAGLVRLYTLDDDAWRKDPYDDGYGTIAHTILSEAGVTLHTPKFIRRLARTQRAPVPQFARRKRAANGSGAGTSNSKRQTNGSSANQSISSLPTQSRRRT
jgi:dCMP deaminase